MEHKVRTGKVSDQDEFRRDDIRRMSPEERVNMLLEMQYLHYNWHENPRIERTASFRHLPRRIN